MSTPGSPYPPPQGGPGPQQPSGPPPGQPPPYGQAPGQPYGQLPGEPTGQPPQKPKRAISVGQILGGILFILVIVFIIENSQKVDIRLIIPVIHRAPLYVAILIAAVLGALIAALLRYRRQRGARRKQMVREHKAEERPPSPPA